MSYFIEKADNTVKKIVSTCFPDYKGHKIQLSQNIPSTLDSYWFEGSRNYFVFYELSTGKIISVKSNSVFENNPNHLESLPFGVILVKHSIVCGKDLGITIYANKIDLTPMLPTPENLPENEIIVLYFTSLLKNSYAGKSHIRFEEANRKYNISRENWINTQTQLIEKGMLRKNKSISPKGRNAIQGIRL